MVNKTAERQCNRCEMFRTVYAFGIVAGMLLAFALGVATGRLT